ncbi:MAG: hypothetical protein IPJ39_13050 [Saprospiraceae bacterium]|nr:hypothetical protein [Saprospiraceae bacterium]
MNGGTWSTTLPVYAQTGPVQSIETRCLCDLDGTTASPVSTAVITAPGTCTLPTQPTITIVNNVCPSTIGTISATGCGSGTTFRVGYKCSRPLEYCNSNIYNFTTYSVCQM